VCITYVHMICGKERRYSNLLSVSFKDDTTGGGDQAHSDSALKKEQLPRGKPKKGNQKRWMGDSDQNEVCNACSHFGGPNLVSVSGNKNEKGEKKGRMSIGKGGGEKKTSNTKKCGGGYRRWNLSTPVRTVKVNQNM